jgi:hypothetical protein
MYSGSARNAVIDRSYVFTFTINAAMGWEYKTVTIPGDVTGAWGKGNTTGLVLSFTFMCGVTNTTAANVWTAGNFSSAPGTTNALQTTSDSWGLTGVVVLPGIEAPSAERSPLIMRPYDQELLTCQRYYYTMNAGNGYHPFVTGGVSSNPNVFSGVLPFPTEMRSSPTFTASPGNAFAAFSGAAVGLGSTIQAEHATPRNTILSLTCSNAMTPGAAGMLQANNTLSARVNFDARL